MYLLLIPALLGFYFIILYLQYTVVISNSQANKTRRKNMFIILFPVRCTNKLSSDINKVILFQSLVTHLNLNYDYNITYYVVDKNVCLTVV